VPPPEYCYYFHRTKCPPVFLFFNILSSRLFYLKRGTEEHLIGHPSILKLQILGFRVLPPRESSVMQKVSKWHHPCLEYRCTVHRGKNFSTVSPIRHNPSFQVSDQCPQISYPSLKATSLRSRNTTKANRSGAVSNSRKLLYCICSKHFQSHKDFSSLPLRIVPKNGASLGLLSIADDTRRVTV